MLIMADQIRRGFPDSGYDVNPAIREFHRYRHGLCVVDGVPCYTSGLSVQISAWGGTCPPIGGGDKGPMGRDWHVIRDKIWRCLK